MFAPELTRLPGEFFMKSKFALKLIRVYALFILGLLGVAAAVCSESNAVLPVGNSPQAVELSWFPNKTCAVIWRNWNLVEIETLAATLKTDPRRVADLAGRLGLPEYRKPTWTASQIYISLLRRS